VCAAQLPLVWNGLTFNAAGTQSVTLASTAGCDSVATLNLNVHQSIASTLSIALCEGEVYTLPDGSEVSVSGSYTTSFTTQFGCDSSITTILTVDPQITITLSNDTSICAGTSISLNASGANQYTWNPAAGLSSTNTAIVTATPTTSTTYVVTGEAGACLATDSVSIEILALPNLSASVNEIVLCEQDSISIEAFGADYFVWNTNNSGTTSCDTCATTIFLPGSSGLITITGYLGQCSSELNVPVQIYARPNAQIQGDSILCLGDTVMLTALGGITYIWSTGDTTSSIYMPALSSGWVELIALNPSCSDTVSFNYGVYSLPVTQIFTSDTTIIYGSNIQIEAQSNASFEWTPANTLNCIDCLDPIAYPEGTTTYCLTSRNSYGCVSFDCIEIIVDTLCENMFIPNVFAPDDKGHDSNNSFRIYGGECIVKMNLSVFSRWGQKVFEGLTLEQAWDGTFNGQPLNSEVFIYMLEAELITGEKITRQGNITLLR
jgi:gliding motility-associated-like protein